MSEHVWVHDSKPDRPGIWAFKTSTNRWVSENVTAKNLHIWDAGTWAFLMDLPTIVDPPRYRPVTAADVGREVQVSDIDESYACDIRAKFIGMDGNRFVACESSGEYGAWKHARILDSGDDGQAKRAREWWINPKTMLAVTNINNAYTWTSRIHVREVID